ncbi:hypothetical protein K501DRAFT_287359 [Backusella circina FSU 941]|nr:hypothetical protein K501DRAFT_287359 [Backusella circina FSU 941]
MSFYIHAADANNNTDDILSQLQNATQQCSNTTVGAVSYAMYCTSLENTSQSNCVVLPTNYTTNGINCTNDGIRSLADQYGKATDQNCFISCTNLPSSTSLSSTITPDFLLMVVAFFTMFLMLGRKE